MSLRTLVFGTFSFVLLWFVGWMAWSIFAARASLPQVFAPHLRSDAWAELTPAQQAMVLRVEDPGFYDHLGVDWSTPGAGASIPERLAEWLFEGSASPGITRAEHALIAAFVITPLTSKEAQLNAYVSAVPLGVRDDVQILGFPMAAEVYFRTPLAALSQNQFARLVALVEDPAEFAMNSDANWERVDRIEALMRGDCAPASASDTRLVACARP